MSSDKRFPTRTTRRAASPETKAAVRQAFIEAGRYLFAMNEGGTASLRQIAALAGYSPGTIYQYFQDRQALQIAIRVGDMEDATVQFEKIAAGVSDPVERVCKLFKGTVSYWLEHLDAFDVLFGRSPKLPPLVTAEGVPYGQTPTVQRALDVYYMAVEEMFANLSSRPVPARLAADTLIGTTYGLVSFPRHTRTMRWSDIQEMADCAIDALVHAWVWQAHAAAATRP